MGTNLDPTGYIERDTDGGRRSGLAQAAMQRLNTLQPMSVQSANPLPTFEKATAVPAAKKEKVSDPTDRPKPVVKKTSRTSTGKVKRRKPDNRLMPLDPTIAQMRIALNRQRAQALKDFARTGRNIGTDYGIAVRGQKQQHPKDIGQLLGAFGARGMGDSGGQVVARTDLERNYQDTLAELARTKGRGLADLSASKAAYLNQHRTQLERLLIQQAERAAAEAGGLGLKKILARLMRDYGRR